MSATRIKGGARPEKITIPVLRDMYLNDEKIAMVTAYDATFAKIFDGAGVDIILVGDSLGMVVKGESNTLGVSLEEVEYHVRCVAKGTRHAHVLADMPFMSYHVSHEDAVANAGRLIKAGAESVKLEGGEEMADLVWYLGTIGIPVMAHLGLRPQHVHSLGGYKIQGKTKAEAEVILEEARIMEEAGVYAILLEGVPLEVAKEVTETVSVPTIGICSGHEVSGQVLVSYDMLGANPEFQPRFVRAYANLHETITKATQSYVSDVRSGAFPSEAESFHRNLVEVKPAKK